MKRRPGAGPLETAYWPEEIRLKSSDRVLVVRYDDGVVQTLPLELLRVESPSAEVQGHTPSQKRIVPGKRAVGVKSIDPVGRYAIRIHFDDGHQTGLYTWKYLRDLGDRQAEVWQTYLDALATRGLSRDAG